MKIECSCGQAYVVPDSWIGKKARCKQCNQEIVIKIPQHDEPFVEQREEIVSLAGADAPRRRFRGRDNDNFVQVIELTSKKMEKASVRRLLN